MVSKVAVIAAVVIIAAPILLGFALNLTETTRTEYTPSNDSVNVTPLLENGIGYTTATADSYLLNTNFTNSRVAGQPIYPVYNTSPSGATSSNFPFLSRSQNWTGGAFNISPIVQYYWSASINYSATDYISLQILENNVVVHTLTRIFYMFYDKNDGEIQYKYWDSSGSKHTSTISPVSTASRFNFTLTNLSSVPIVFGALYDNNPSDFFVDLSGGFYFPRQLHQGNAPYWFVKLPSDTMSIAYSINLNSITTPTHTLTISHYLNNANSMSLQKTTYNGVVNWKLKFDPGTSSETVYDLYYDPSITDNTYQFIFTQTNQEPVDNSTTKYYYHAEARYVGHWQKMIGVSNYYQKYEYDYDLSSSDGNGLRYIRLGIDIAYSSRTPTMRVDAATFKAFEFNTIENNTYTPASFKTNPSTTITSISHYGTSLEFAGNTYNVKDGKITINTHDVPIDKLVFKSVPDGNGRYDNMIGNTLISTSGTPSTITFNGQWAASVDTSSSEQIIINEVEWNAGKFAWDGIDTNFLLVGIITAFAAMVGVGIYAKNRRLPLIPLMIVCGCAGILFLIMI